MTDTVLIGDCRDGMRRMLDSGSRVQTCVTSPPYWGLRDYGHSGQLGLESTPQQFVQNLVYVFRIVRELLKDDGVLWLNLGDSYNSGSSGGFGGSTLQGGKENQSMSNRHGRKKIIGLKQKDLIGIPWRVAFALQDDGWYLRQDVIWAKPNPMPESVTDRCTRSHEYLFMLTKKAKYYYDAESIRSAPQEASFSRWNQDIENQNGSERANGGSKTNGTMKAVGGKQRGHSRRHAGFNDRWDQMSVDEQRSMGANKRSVWTVATMPYSGAHFATFPEKLIEPCILSSSRIGDTVLDPFMGSGTTAHVAQRLGRHWLGCELNPDYEKLQKERTQQGYMVL